MKTKPAQRTRKLLLAGMTGLLVSGIAAHAIAAPDYDRIRKDINVMIGIVKSSFDDSESCKRCSVRISGHYLAEQGVVFDVNPAGTFQNYTIHLEDEMDVLANELGAIPGIVADVLADVRVNMDGKDPYQWEFYTEENWTDMTRETRQKLRETQRSLRELTREMREIEIESIHAEEAERKELEKRRSALEKAISETEAEQLAVEQEIAAYAKQKKQEREAKMAERNKERRQRFEQMETIVLNTFCDYSSSMRNIPRDEKISIIMHRDEDSSNIFVFDQDKLQNCDSRKSNVREHALSYAF